MFLKNIDDFSLSKRSKSKETQKDKIDISCSTNSPFYLRAKTGKNKRIFDKDKIRLNNVNLLSYHNKNLHQIYSPVKIKRNEVYSIRKFIINVDNPNLRNNNNIFYNLEKLTNKYCNNLFKNKYIRECSQKLLSNQVNITDYNLTCNMSNFGKNNSSRKNKNSVIIDDSKINNFDNEKNIILNVFKTQSKSNFNNKYKIIYKSSNSKKRESIQKYFSSIKKVNYLSLSKSNFKNKKLSIGIKGLITHQKFKKLCTEGNFQRIKDDLKDNKNNKKFFIPILSRTSINKNIITNKINNNNSMNV